MLDYPGTSAPPMKTSVKGKLSLNYHHDVGLLENNAKAICN